MSAITPQLIYLADQYDDTKAQVQNNSSKDLTLLHKFLGEKYGRTYSSGSIPREIPVRKVMLFKIKNAKGKTVGYFLPTIHHVVNKSLKRFPLKILKALSKCATVWLESEEGVKQLHEKRSYYDGIDKALFDYTKLLHQKIKGIESEEFDNQNFGNRELNTNTTEIKPVDKVKVQSPKEKYIHGKNELYNKYFPVFEELWGEGEHDLFQALCQYITKLSKPTLLTKLEDTRNREMARVINKTLKEEENNYSTRQRHFFSAGALHSCDLEFAPSVQTLLKEKGWSIVQCKVSTEKVDLKTFNLPSLQLLK